MGYLVEPRSRKNLLQMPLRQREKKAVHKTAEATGDLIVINL